MPLWAIARIFSYPHRKCEKIGLYGKKDASIF